MLTKFLNNYGYMILGGAMIIGFSAFKGAEAYTGKSLAPVTVYFNGDPLVASQVADESRWTTTPNGHSCNTTDNKACSLPVDNTDLSGSALNPAKISMDAIPGAAGAASGYIPQRTGGSGSTPFNPVNRN